MRHVTLQVMADQNLGGRFGSVTRAFLGEFESAVLRDQGRFDVKNHGPGKTFFRVIGIPLAVISVLSGVLALILKVREGRALDTYHSAKMVEWSYGAAVTTIAVLVAAMLVAWSIRFALRWRERRELERLGKQRDA